MTKNADKEPEFDENGILVEEFDLDGQDTIIDPAGKILMVLYIIVPNGLPVEEYGVLVGNAGQRIEYLADVGTPTLAAGYQSAGGFLLAAGKDDQNQKPAVIPYAIQAIDGADMARSDPWLALSVSHARIHELLGEPVAVLDDDEESRS